MNILYQEDLINKTIKYDTFNEFPKSNLFIGDEGCGKSLLTSYISNMVLRVPCKDITNSITNELIMDLYTSSLACIYKIDISELAAVKRYLNVENSILKLIEEPPSNAVIVIHADSRNQVLDTIYNRCIKWIFKPYTTEQLKYFANLNELDIDDVTISTMMRTPGDVIKGLSKDEYAILFDVCNNIIDNIHRANLSNTLTLTKHVKFKEDSSGYELSVFFRAMLRCLIQRLTTNCYNSEYERFFKVTKKSIEESYILNINKEHLFNKYILELKYGH